MKIIVDEEAYMPEKAHEADAGYDLRTPERLVIRPYDSVKVDLGVHFEIPRGYVGFLKSKSGLNVRYGITCEGVIDSGYTGSVVAKLYNHSSHLFVFDAGDKVVQIVFLPILSPELEKVERFDETERGNNGFGSSGK